MPATSEKQRTLFRIARSMQEGKTKLSYSTQAAKIAKTVSAKDVHTFASNAIRTTRKKRRS